MKILVIGDVVGRSGRDAVKQYLPGIVKEYATDYVILNADNAAHGFGVNPDICKSFFSIGVNCITGGNHIWDQREIIPYIDKEPRLLRPVNYPPGTYGNGFLIDEIKDGRKIAVIHALGRVFMDETDDPFRTVRDLIDNQVKKSKVNACIIDFHAETTSEKNAFAHYLDGSVCAVLGTHTHVPTADARILEKGTAYQTDIGMCGDYNSVIGVKKHVPIHKFVKKTPIERMSPATGEASFCSTLVQVDDDTGLAQSITPIIKGGCLG